MLKTQWNNVIKYFLIIALKNVVPIVLEQLKHLWNELVETYDNESIESIKKAALDGQEIKKEIEKEKKELA